MYTKPLFSWRKALFASTDKRDLYDFARAGLRNLAEMHRALARESFRFRPAVALHRNFRGKKRTLYIYPWEERLVDLLLYRLLSGKLNEWFSPNSYAYRLRGFGLDRCQRKIASLLARAETPLFAIKRDIANYFPSVDHELLRAQLAELIAPGDYLLQLAEERLRFKYEDDGQTHCATQGIAFGTPVACFFANVYLTPLDRKLDAIPRLHYFRYADDLLMLAAERATIENAAAIFDETLAELRLRSKASHEENVVLVRGGNARAEGESEERFHRSSSARAAAGSEERFIAQRTRDAAEVFAPLRMTTGATATGFTTASRIRHLGLEFCVGGGVRLSRDKCRKICNIFRYAFRRKRAKLARIHDSRKRAEFAIAVAKHALEQGLRNVAIIDYYLKHVSDEAQLRLLDRWLAEEVLSLAFGGGHRKSYFRLLPYRSLRAMGLPSLVHRRKQIRHGQIAAPFFVWKAHQTQKSSRETAVKLRPLTAEAPAFSPSPEAVASRASQEALVRERSHLSRGLIEDGKSEDLPSFP